MIGNRHGRDIGRQPCQPGPHAGRVLGVLPVEPFLEGNLDGLRQRLPRLGSELPCQPVRLIALDAQCYGRSLDYIRNSCYLGISKEW